MGLLKEFKEFAIKGNMVDMAVGIIIGTAFSGLVTSLVSDVIMPPVGLLSAGTDFAEYDIPLQETEGEEEAVSLKIGSFADKLIQFLLLAFAVFMLVKAINSMRKKEEEEKPTTPPKQEALLEEIRDLLKKS